MAQSFTDNERILISKLGIKTLPTATPGEGIPPINAIWLGRDAAGIAHLRAYLRVVGSPQERDQILAWTERGSKGRIRTLRRIPLGEVAWFFHGPLPPAAQAKIRDPEPLLNLLGEAAADRLRRMAGVGPATLIQPTERIQCVPGLSVEAVEADPEPNALRYGWRRERTKLVLMVQNRAGPRPSAVSSAAMSLAAWFSGFTEGLRTWDWGCATRIEANASSQSLPWLRTYPALRLPMLRLPLEHRASRQSRLRFASELEHLNVLPIRLVYSRLASLLRAAEDGLVHL